jgi:O-acetyl-ADP-ribose deacetylase (regulator of RNase III)
VYRFPRPQAASIAVDTLRSTPTAVERILLVAFDEETAQLYRDLTEGGG